jgi:hypothetical protein
MKCNAMQWNAMQWLEEFYGNNQNELQELQIARVLLTEISH